MMDSFFRVNQVIHDNITCRDYRILWISPSDEQPSWWMRLQGKSNIPEPVSLDDISAGMEIGRYRYVPDLWRPTWKDTAGETAIRLRDRAWELIRPAVMNEPAIYDRKTRRTILKGIEQATGTDLTNLYKHLGRYWRYGKVPDALLPDYSMCGKTRDPYKETAKRPGKKKAAGAVGKKLSAQDLRNFSSALIRYHLVGNRLSLEKTYQRLIEDFYSVKDKNGNIVGPMDPDEVPSRNQFFYWNRTNADALYAAVGGRDKAAKL